MRRKKKNNLPIILLLSLFSFIAIVLAIANFRVYRQFLLLQKNNEELEKQMEIPELPEVNPEQIMRDQLLLQREGEEVIVILRDEEEDEREEEEGWLERTLNIFR